METTIQNHQAQQGKTTNFFSLLEATINHKGTLTIVVKRLPENRMTASVLLSNDTVNEKNGKLIQPLLLNGNVTDLDEGFFRAIETPLQKTADLLTNMEAHLKSLEEAKTKAKPQQGKNSGNNKEKPLETENAEAYKEALSLSVQLEKDMKYTEALEALPDPAVFPKKENEIAKRRKELEAKEKLYSMF